MPPKGRTTKPTEPVSESESSDSEPEVATKTTKSSPAETPAKPRGTRKPHEFNLDCLKLDDDYKVPEDKKSDPEWVATRLHNMMEQRDEVSKLMTHCMQVVKSLTSHCDRYAKLAGSKQRKPRDPSKPDRKKSGVNEVRDVPEELAKFITKHKADICKEPKGKEQYDAFEASGNRLAQTNVATLLYYAAKASATVTEVNGKNGHRMSDAVWKALRFASIVPKGKGKKIERDDHFKLTHFVSAASQFYPKTTETTEVTNTVEGDSSNSSGSSGESDSGSDSGSESEGEPAPKRTAPAPAPAKKPRKAA
jgi:hypothetical protein